MSTIVHLELISDVDSESGAFGREAIEAAVVSDDLYRILWTPVAVMGFARDDVIQRAPSSASGFELAEWGRRIGVVFLLEKYHADARRAFSDALCSIGGEIENVHTTAFAGSVPDSVGHRATATALDMLVLGMPSSHWYYANAWNEDESASPWAVSFLNR